jgi:hypothetical protein
MVWEPQWIQQESIDAKTINDRFLASVPKSDSDKSREYCSSSIVTASFSADYNK